MKGTTTSKGKPLTTQDISSPVFQFPEVAQVEQLPETSKNQETQALGNAGPFSWKPGQMVWNGNLRNLL